MEKLEQNIKTLLERGKRRGYLTYEEMNRSLPEEGVSPDRLDHLLMTLDDLRINLLDEEDVPKQQQAKGHGQIQTETRPASRTADLVEATARIDDPVRMYLQQMGVIPLLTRQEEISLAKKIELSRKRFRRKLLESDLALTGAVEILSQVAARELPFDRNMKVSSAETLAKPTILKRLPENLRTARRMLAQNRAGWAKLRKSSGHNGQNALVKRLYSRRLGLDLPDAFPGDLKDASDLLQGVRVAVSDTVP